MDAQAPVSPKIQQTICSWHSGATITTIEVDAAIPPAQRLGEALRIAVTLGVNLAEADLRGADLLQVDLSGANLAFADFTGATCENTCFRHAHLSGAVFRRADLTQAVMTGANLSRADLTSANLVYADLTAADLREAEGVFSLGTPGGETAFGWLCAGFLCLRLQRGDYRVAEARARWPGLREMPSAPEMSSAQEIVAAVDYGIALARSRGWALDAPGSLTDVE
jgi:hypothetical protein